MNATDTISLDYSPALTPIVEPAPTRRLLILRAMEMIVLLVIPPIIWFTRVWQPPILPALLVMGIYALVTLLRDPAFDRANLWRGVALRRELLPILLLFTGGLLVFGLSVWFFIPEQLFILPRNRPGLWLLILFGYPIFSVYPQELIYRAFFFHRFKHLLPNRWAMIVGSAVLFCWAHLLFQHWIPMVSTLIGGLIFAWRFDRTRSLAATCIEHALYGQLIFTIGLGQYFFHGTFRTMQTLSGQ